MRELVSTVVVETHHSHSQYSNKEIFKSKIQLHLAYCLKNIKKCQFCSEPCNGADGLAAHMEKLKGTYDSIRQAIEQIDTSLLKGMAQH